MPTYSNKAIDFVRNLFNRRRRIAEGEELFTFFSLRLPEDTFFVVRFEGEERLNQLYRFEFILVSDRSDLDVDTVLMSPVLFLYLRGPGRNVPLHGIITEFEQMHEALGQYYYRAVMAPKLWLLTQTQHNQVFLDQTVPDMLKQVLLEGGLTSLDFEFRLQGNYDQAREYICQYNETYFDFFARRLERMGMYFYFDVTSEGEKVIITDSLIAHEPHIHGDDEILYLPPSTLPENRRAVIQKFSMRQQRLPSEVMLRDYNYRHPGLELGAWTSTKAEGGGRVYSYGEHFQTPEEGLFLARIRAQEINCRQKIFHGEGTAPYLRPGFTFKLTEHFRDSFNVDYLTTGIRHEGAQTLAFVSGVKRELSPQEQESFYRNSFSAIPREVQYRPPREHRRSRFYGTLNAHIDAAGSGQYAEVDDQGRYKVALPFDLSGRKAGKASSWLRMSQPYVGAGHGMHFPLHKGAEVLLSFIEGNPDRPIITGAVPNPDQPGVMHSLNQTRGGFQTAGGNMLLTEDKKGKERMLLRSGDKGSQISFGAGSPSEIFLGSSFSNEIAGMAMTQSAGYIGQVMSMFKYCSMTGFRKLQLLLKSLERLVEMAPELVALTVTGFGETESEDLEKRQEELEGKQEALAEKKAELDEMDAEIHDLENEIKTLSDIISFMEAQNNRNPSQEKSDEIAAAKAKLDEMRQQLEQEKQKRNKLALEIKTEADQLKAEGSTLQKDAEATSQKYDEIAGITKIVAPVGVLVASLLIKLLEANRVKKKIEHLAHKAHMGEPAVFIGNMRDGNIFHMASPMIPNPLKNKDIAMMSEHGQVQLYADKEIVTTSGATTQINAPAMEVNASKVDIKVNRNLVPADKPEINISANTGDINTKSCSGDTNIQSENGNINVQTKGSGNIKIGPDEANVNGIIELKGYNQVTCFVYNSDDTPSSGINIGKNSVAVYGEEQYQMGGADGMFECTRDTMTLTHPTQVKINELCVTPQELTFKGSRVQLG
jgi:type VI secretion system VgrG family protein